jgi:hypothetical protein
MPNTPSTRSGASRSGFRLAAENSDLWPVTAAVLSAVPPGFAGSGCEIAQDADHQLGVIAPWRPDTCGKGYSALTCGFTPGQSSGNTACL